jgi:hypothetical protein
MLMLLPKLHMERILGRQILRFPHAYRPNILYNLSELCQRMVLLDCLCRPETLRGSELSADRMEYDSELHNVGMFHRRLRGL